MNLQTYLMIKSAARYSADDPRYKYFTADDMMDFLTASPEEEEKILAKYNDKVKPATDKPQNLVNNVDTERLRTTDVVAVDTKPQPTVNSKPLSTAVAKTNASAATVKQHEESSMPQNNAKDRMRRNTSYAGASKPVVVDTSVSKPVASDTSVNKPVVIDTPVNPNKPTDIRRIMTQYGLTAAGGGAGAGLGYAGSNWLSKKLGLKGKKGWRRAADIALRTTGTAGGAALGGYGSYRLGDYVNKKLYGAP